MKSPYFKLMIGLCLLLILGVLVWQQSRVVHILPTNIAVKHEEHIRAATVGNGIKPEKVESKETGTIKSSLGADQSTEALVAGSLSIPVVFEDNPQDQLSKEQRIEVVRDIQLIYGHLDQFETYDTNPREMKLDGIGLTVVKKIKFVGSGRYFPLAHRDAFGLLAGKPDRYNLVIPSELISAYRQALDFIANNRQAFDQLKLFLPESGNHTEAWAKLVAADVVWTPDSVNMSSKTRERIFSQIKNARIRRPSILDFLSIEKDAANSGFPELPEGSIVGKALILDGKNIPQNYEAIVYIGGTWHIAVVPPGT